MTFYFIYSASFILLSVKISFSSYYPQANIPNQNVCYPKKIIHISGI